MDPSLNPHSALTFNVIFIFAQSMKPEFDTSKDYLDLVMQFGYITMFTSAWGLLPICALVRTTFEYKGDTYRLLIGSRRPIQLASVENIGACPPNSPLVKTALSAKLSHKPDELLSVAS